MKLRRYCLVIRQFGVIEAMSICCLMFFFRDYQDFVSMFGSKDEDGFCMYIE